MTQTLTAENLFRSAYENRYTWDAQFPGYSCDVTMTTPEGSYTAHATIDSDLKFEVTAIEDDSAKKAITQQLWEITIHRVNHSFAKSHGENTFTFGDSKDGEVEIMVGGASAGNRYKVKDKHVTFVYRRMGAGIVSIHTYGFLDTDKGYLSTGYDSLYLDAETLQPKGGKTVFEDTFNEIDGYYILTNRKITKHENDTTSITEFDFSNITL